jgi:hypothetical protein
MGMPTTASVLCNLVQCPHRLNLDLHGDPGKRDSESKFVELLWERGIDSENEVIANLMISFKDLHSLDPGRHWRGGRYERLRSDKPEKEHKDLQEQGD